MYESMQLLTEGYRTYSFKIRQGFLPCLDKAKQVAIKAAEEAKKRGEQAIPYVQLSGKCVWSPLADKLLKGTDKLSTGTARMER